MRKVLRVLTVIAATTALCGVILSAAYTQMVEKEVTRLRRESRSDIVYLRTRVRELESELTAGLLAHREDCQPPDDLPVGGGVEEETAEDGTETETETMSETAENGESEAPSETESDGETVTVPTHNSPETQEPTETLPETDAPVALYVLTVYKSGQPNMGASFFLNGFTCVFLGSMVLKLGKTHVVGTLIGTIVLATLTSGLTMQGAGFAVGQVTKGLLLILGVSVVTIYRRKIVPRGRKMKYE